MRLYEAVKEGPVYLVITCPNRGPQIPVLGEVYTTRKAAKRNAMLFSMLMPGDETQEKIYADLLCKYKREHGDRLKRERAKD